MTIQARTERTGPRLDPRRGTSALVWACILVTVGVLIAVRLPQLERLVEARTSDLLDELADPELGAASMRIGAITAIVVFVVVAAVIAIVVGLLERWLGPTAIGRRSWMRIGAGGATVAVVGIGLQAAAVALAVPAVERSPFVLAGILAVAALVPVAFRDARRPAGYARAVVVTVLAGVLLWLQ